MLSAVQQLNPDIVIVQGIAGNITYQRIISWANRKNKKIIIWACAWEPGRAKGFLFKIKNKLVASFFRNADYFLTYSSHASKYVQDMGIKESIIETCYNGLEIDSLVEHHDQLLNKSKELINKYNLDFNISFLFVGALIPAKKPLMLLDAFIQLRKKYKNIKLIIIGDGPLRSVIEEKIKMTEDPNIYYLGRIIEGVDTYFAACDCFVLPGIGGLALNQAMYWGKPCIVSKADGTEDDLVIEGVTGYRFKESDLGSLVSAMERRINEKQVKLSKMSEKSCNKIQRISNVNNMVRIFSDAIDKLSV
jgi:glycosyltransferase involved in cell wall biosynthesis